MKNDNDITPFLPLLLSTVVVRFKDGKGEVRGQLCRNSFRNNTLGVRTGKRATLFFEPCEVERIYEAEEQS